MYYCPKLNLEYSVNMNKSISIATLPIFLEVSELVSNIFNNDSKLTGLTSEQLSLFSQVNPLLPRDMQIMIAISDCYVEIPQKTLILARMISQRAPEISDILESLDGTLATKFY